MCNSETIENFYCVYLLYCQNVKFKGRTYIGYTVDPNRRIKQHNKGLQYGGAWKTNKKGPWTMVMIIHGFPNDISALRFEWAWQHPQISRRLKHVSKRKPREKSYDFCLRVLSEMLQVPPWCRLPLTIRWLNQEFIKEFPFNKNPPLHMPISTGTVISKKIEKNTCEKLNTGHETFCIICNNSNGGTFLECLNTKCKFQGHMRCLSKYFLQSGEYVPVEGNCPKCQKYFLWGDLIRKFKGCDNDIYFDADVTTNLYLSDDE